MSADDVISLRDVKAVLAVNERDIAGAFQVMERSAAVFSNGLNKVARTQREMKEEQDARNEEQAAKIAKLERVSKKKAAKIAELERDGKEKERDIAKLKEAVDDVVNKVNTSNASGSDLRRHKIGVKVNPLLPRLIDGFQGVAGWVPVDHHMAGNITLKLVVLSVPATKHLLTSHDPTLAEVDVEGFLYGAFERYQFPGFTNGKMDIKEFVKLLLQTPFRKYQVAPNSPTTQKKNLERFIIMDQAYWRKLLDDILAEFGEEARGEMKEVAVPDGLMTQDWALTAVPRENPSAKGPSTFIDLLGRSLTEAERKACPPMNSQWSKEAYQSMRGFFGIPEGGPKRHVRSGVYDPSKGERVGSFAAGFQHLHVAARSWADAIAAKRRAKTPQISVKVKGKGKGKAFPTGEGKPSSSGKGKGKGKASTGETKKRLPSREDEEDNTSKRTPSSSGKAQGKGKGKALPATSGKKKRLPSREDDRAEDTPKRKKLKKSKKSRNNSG